MTGKQFELEVLNNYEYVIAEFDKDNYYLDDENSAKSLECRLNELFEENEELKQQVQKIHKLINSKIQSARELGSVRTVVALKNLQRELNGDVE